VIIRIWQPTFNVDDMAQLSTTQFHRLP
jgi:hypothetical protein